MASSAHACSRKRYCDRFRIAEHVAWLETGLATEGCGDPDARWHAKRQREQGRYRATRLCRLWTAGTWPPLPPLAGAVCVAVYDGFVVLGRRRLRIAMRLI